MRSTAGIAVVVLLGACNLVGEPGSGKPKSESRAVAPFTDIDLSGAIDADITVAPTQSVEVSGDDNLVPLVATEVKDGRLRVHTTRSVRPKLPLVVKIAVPAVAFLSVSGASRIKLTGVHSDKLRIELSGAGKMTADGEVARLELEVSGAGAVDAKALRAKTADVSLSGAGALQVYAAEALSARVSGAGKVTCYGDPPDVKKDVSGAGTVEMR